jgi:hypothetical protein
MNLYLFKNLTCIILLIFIIILSMPIIRHYTSVVLETVFQQTTPQFPVTATQLPTTPSTS